MVKAEVRERVKRRFRMHRNECSYERLNKMLVAGYEVCVSQGSWRLTD